MGHFASGVSTLVQILVTPDFNMAATMGFVDPFRVANYLEGGTAVPLELCFRIRQ